MAVKDAAGEPGIAGYFYFAFVRSVHKNFRSDNIRISRQVKIGIAFERPSRL
jgi:hypothetical protein